MLATANRNVPAVVFREQFRPLLAALLRERFKLSLHKDVKELPAYALVVARRNGKLGSSFTSPISECVASPPAASERGSPRAPESDGESRPCGALVSATGTPRGTRRRARPLRRDARAAGQSGRRRPHEPRRTVRLGSEVAARCRRRRRYSGRRCTGVDLHRAQRTTRPQARLEEAARRRARSSTAQNTSRQIERAPSRRAAESRAASSASALLRSCGALRYSVAP